MNPLDVVLRVHQRTKHHPFKYARSLGYLDWDTQPDPFLRFSGAPVVPLDRGPFGDDLPFVALDRAGGARPGGPAPIDARGIAELLYHAVAISAWKEFESSRWSLRCNPSSGNLHPTETYVVAPRAAGIGDAAAVHHYRPDLHALEERRRLDEAALSTWLGDPPRVLVGFSSIAWREAWKYGERAFRYCQHDVGHAIAAVAYAAAVLGWEARAELHPSDAALARLLRTETSAEPERELADVLLSVGPGAASRAPLHLDVAQASALLAGADRGTAAALSSDHHEWPMIAEAAAACEKEGGAPSSLESLRALDVAEDAGGPGARAILRGRRSAVALDGVTTLPRDAFLRMTRRLLPSAGTTPWTSLPWRPAVHPFFFVHRVDGLAPGLYVLVRDPRAEDALRTRCDPRFAWSSVDAAAAPGLFLLAERDVRAVAQAASCHQDIASDGAFAVAIVAEFEPRLREEGAWFYRALHWEAGAIGHVLYLEAEAAGIRGTGIGCFFDDLTHQALGLAGTDFQTVYHFTVGGPVDDPRLVTRPAYS